MFERCTRSTDPGGSESRKPIHLRMVIDRTDTTGNPAAAFGQQPVVVPAHRETAREDLPEKRITHRGESAESHPRPLSEVSWQTTGGDSASPRFQTAARDWAATLPAQMPDRKPARTRSSELRIERPMRGRSNSEAGQAATARAVTPGAGPRRSSHIVLHDRGPTATATRLVPVVGARSSWLKRWVNSWARSSAAIGRCPRIAQASSGDSPASSHFSRVSASCAGSCRRDARLPAALDQAEWRSRLPLRS